MHVIINNEFKDTCLMARTKPILSLDLTQNIDYCNIQSYYTTPASKLLLKKQQAKMSFIVFFY